jgi:hypothetical protein
MLRRIFRTIVVLVVLLAIGAAVLVFTARPRLENSRRDVDTAWSTLQPSLDGRYKALLDTNSAVQSAAGSESHAIFGQVSNALDRWATAGKSSTTGAVIANTLEGLAARLRSVVLASPKLVQAPAAVNAFKAFDQAAAPSTAVVTYNNAVSGYQGLRDDTLKGIVAHVFGFNARAMYLPPVAG